jgi:sulfate adenylyltransferase
LSQVRRVDLPRRAGRGPLCGHVAEGFLALFCGGFFWRVFGRLLWLCVLFDVVMDWWRVYGHPFVSVKYLRAKEEALEVL